MDWMIRSLLGYRVAGWWVTYVAWQGWHGKKGCWSALREVGWRGKGQPPPIEPLKAAHWCSPPLLTVSVFRLKMAGGTSNVNEA